jgi:hypothetical protein
LPHGNKPRVCSSGGSGIDEIGGAEGVALTGSATSRLRHDAPFWLLAVDMATKPFFSMNASLAADLYAASAQTPLAVLVLSSSSSRNWR